MGDLLWTIVLIPFLGSAILAVFGAFMPKKIAGTIACASIGIAWFLSIIVAIRFVETGTANVPLYRWIYVNGLHADMSLHLDALSMLMVGVVTFVAFLIHLYAAQSMYAEDGYSRFFSYMNLFVGFMLILVLAANLLVLYLGWEGVGLCSFLLIGFWYKDIKNVHAAQKAFIITRIGDTALAIGLFLLFREFGTLDIQTILSNAGRVLPFAGATAAVIGFCLIGGAIGKSAQIPLQTWLPDAMAGPTPVSALIHAATMVTAGVYLLARMHTIISMSPAAQLSIAVIGTITLLYAGFSALTQVDIKRVLAYSTMSQIGYMFVALGVGAWTGAMFHFMTHAFFKALLFLSAGIVIDSLGGEHDIFKMGGLRTRLPIAFWTFLVGSASLSALPFITAGFYSKDEIIWAEWSSQLGSIWLLAGGLLGSLITAAYAFRVVFLVFYGEAETEVINKPGMLEKLAVIVLSIFSIIAGFISLPKALGGFDPFGRFLSGVLPHQPAAAGRSGLTAEEVILALSSTLSILGIYLAYAYFKNRLASEALGLSPTGIRVHTFLYSGWGADKLYDRVFARPYKALATWNRNDFIDKFYSGLGALARYANHNLSRTQTGKVRNYAAAVLFGAIVIAAIVLLR